MTAPERLQSTVHVASSNRAESVQSASTSDSTPVTARPPRAGIGRRRRWLMGGKLAGAAAVAVGAGFAVYQERATLVEGLAVLGARTQLGWVFACVGVQCLSMVFFALLQQRLLKAGGVRLTTRWLLSMAHLANAVAISVPVIGSGMATTYVYHRLRERGVDPVVAQGALALAGVVSTVSFATVVVAAALISGSPTAALSAALGAMICVLVLALCTVLMHSPAGRSRLMRTATLLCSITKRVVRRPRAEPGQFIGSAVERLRLFRLTAGTLAVAWTWGILNWAADACCLIVAVKAVGVSASLGGILLAWSAGQGAASFSPTPAGIGVVEVAMTATMVAAGVKPGDAFAAVLLYRIVSFKFVFSLAWFTERIVSRRGGSLGRDNELG
jgi:putative heme transporter